MRRLFLKILYILAVFFLFLTIFFRLAGVEEMDQTSALGSAGLPVVKLTLSDGSEAATLHGYLDDMSIPLMRGTILPVADDRKVHLRIVTYGEPLDNVTYEVRDITGERLIEQAMVTERRETPYGDMELSFTLKDLLDAGEEYSLVLKALTSRGTVNYYSRILIAGDEGEAFSRDALSFAAEFHDMTFDKGRNKELITYLESDRTGDNTTFAHVNIHSSLSQVTWGDLPVDHNETHSMQIDDLKDDVIMLTLRGEVILVSDEGRQNPYDMTEYFRLRRGESRLYLLDYDRTMQYRFLGDASDFGADKIGLGIGSADIPFMESESGDVIVFQGGDRLFEYRKKTGELITLFSFEDNENGDERSTFRQHDYHVLEAFDDGNVSFLVAGYMNRGEHEGHVGVAYYQYSADIKQLTERAFLPSAASPEILRAYVDRMAYSGTRDELYLMLADDVIMVDPDTGGVETVIENAASSPYFRSNSGAIFARSEGAGGQRITMAQFRNGEMGEIVAQPGTMLLPLGFMQEDLVYGIVYEEDVRRDQTGSFVYPMRRVLIRDAAGNQLENYEREGVFVVSADIEGNQIRLNRVILDENTGFYEETEGDQIVNTLEAKSRINRVITVVTEPWERVVEIDLREEVDVSRLKLINPRFVQPEENAQFAMPDPEPRGTYFYVYGGASQIPEILSDEAEAVTAAVMSSASVVDNHDRYVWQKRGLSARNQIMAITHAAAASGPYTGENTSAECLKLMLDHRGVNRNTQELLDEGASFAEILNICLPECRALTLTGCDLSAMLYYVNQDIPVLVSLRDSNALLLIGFNESELVLVDPSRSPEERVYKITRSQGNRLFEQSGNRFTTYYFR